MPRTKKIVDEPLPEDPSVALPTDVPLKEALEAAEVPADTDPAELSSEAPAEAEADLAPTAELPAQEPNALDPRTWPKDGETPVDPPRVNDAPRASSGENSDASTSASEATADSAAASSSAPGPDAQWWRCIRDQRPSDCPPFQSDAHLDKEMVVCPTCKRENVLRIE